MKEAVGSRASADANARAVVERYFEAMRSGAAGGEAMMALFAEDAIYTEPFSGQPRTHRGRDAIRRSYLDSRQHAPPDMTLSLDRVELDGEHVRAEWTCCSPALPGPVCGQDVWTLEDGKIQRLETILVAHAADEYASKLPPSQAALVRALAGLVRQAAPQARESIKWAQPVWELNGPLCYLKAFTTRTNLGFWRGAELDDPGGVLQGSGGKMRHMPLSSAEDIPAETLRRLVQQAVELNRRLGDPTKRRTE